MESVSRDLRAVRTTHDRLVLVRRYVYVAISVLVILMLWSGYADLPLVTLALLLTICALIAVEHDLNERLLTVRLAWECELAYSDSRAPFLALRSVSSSWLTIGPPDSATLEDGLRPGPAVRIEGKSLLPELAVATNQWGRLVTLGHDTPGLTEESASNLVVLPTTDDTWQHAFELCADHARLIFLIPGVTHSLLYEVNALIDRGHVEHTVVIMPPVSRAHMAEHRLWFDQQWRHVAEQWALTGRRLPPYDPAGMLFLAAGDFSPRRRASLDHQWSPQSVRAAVDDLLHHITDDTGGPAARLMEAVGPALQTRRRVRIPPQIRPI